MRFDFEQICANILKPNKIEINHKIMSQDRLIKIAHKATGEILYTTKNKKGVERKIKLKKYSKKLRKRVEFSEIKK